MALISRHASSCALRAEPPLPEFEAYSQWILRRRYCRRLPADAVCPRAAHSTLRSRLDSPVFPLRERIVSVSRGYPNAPGHRRDVTTPVISFRPHRRALIISPRDRRLPPACSPRVHGGLLENDREENVSFLYLDTRSIV